MHCSKCGSTNGEIKSGTNKKGPWQGFKCADCNEMTWMKPGVSGQFQQPSQTPKKEKKEVDWDAKERRMVRMNSLSHATEIVKTSVKDDVGEDSMAQLVTKVAEQLENWVYRKNNSSTEETPF